MCNRIPIFRLSWWNSAPGPWLSLLVPAVVLALALTAHCAETPPDVGRASLPAVLPGDPMGRPYVSVSPPPPLSVSPLVPADFYAAERLLLLERYPGRVLSGYIERQDDTQTLICELLVAPGKVETVKVPLVGTGGGGDAGTRGKNQ